MMAAYDREQAYKARQEGMAGDKTDATANSDAKPSETSIAGPKREGAEPESICPCCKTNCPSWAFRKQ